MTNSLLKDKLSSEAADSITDMYT